VIAWHAFVGLFTQALQQVAGALSAAGPHRWAIAIVTVTVATRVALIPLVVLQKRAQSAVDRLQPEVGRISKRYRGNWRRIADETAALYKREGVSPLRPFVWLFAQSPFFVALYRAVHGLGVSFVPFLTLGNLANAASSSPGGILLLVAMALANWLYTTRLPGDARQRRFVQVMQLGFVAVAAAMPGTVALYWTVQTLFVAVQQRLIS
jgi:YidC/Oxa1 family membrane protein insertase